MGFSKKAPSMETPPVAPAHKAVSSAITLQPGLMVCHTTAHDLGAVEQRRTFDSDCGFIHFNCQLAGHFDGRVAQYPLQLRQGHISCGYPAGERFSIRHCGQFQNMEVMVTPALLCHLLGEQAACMQGLQPAPDFFLHAPGICRQSLRAARKLRSLLAHATPQPLLLHAATLEFLHCHWAAWAGDSNGYMGVGGLKGLSARERHALDDARALLLHDLSAPPTIAWLARAVGMNQCKLKKAFKAYFGSTIYALFQHKRMCAAKRLLRQHNVTETAILLGYSNISHFSAAFARQFGCLPSRIRQQE